MRIPILTWRHRQPASGQRKCSLTNLVWVARPATVENARSARNDRGEDKNEVNAEVLAQPKPQSGLVRVRAARLTLAGEWAPSSTLVDR